MISGPLQIAGIDLPQSFLTLVGEEFPAIPERFPALKLASQQSRAPLRHSGGPEVVVCVMYVSLTWDREAVMSRFQMHPF